MTQAKYSNTPPLSRAKAESCGKMFGLDAREGFGECVSCHIFSRAVNELNKPFLDDISNKMIPDINMLHASMIQAFLGKCNGGL